MLTGAGNRAGFFAAEKNERTAVMTTKEKLLTMLTAGKDLSGEALARELGVSRNAVWKAMAQLREQGYGIEAVTNRGYRLVSSPERLSREEISRFLTTKAVGRTMEIHDTLDSTNIRAKTLAAEGAPHGLAVIADAQSRGRGRLGRSFFSPGRAGIYLSYVLRPACNPGQAALITSLTAVAVAEAIERVADADVKIKWVNDLYLGGKKICGILCEAGMGMEAGQLDYVVAGIGVNTGETAFPRELEQIATSIANETGRTPDRNRLIAEISNRLEERFGQLETGEFLEESRRRSNVIGQQVTVLEGGRQYPAMAEGIDGQGRLLIRTEEGTACLGFGEVSLRLHG